MLICDICRYELNETLGDVAPLSCCADGTLAILLY